jgi:predicted secreted protein
VNLRIEDYVSIIATENPSTGYHWNISAPARNEHGEQIIEIIKNEYIPPESNLTAKRLL